MDTSNQVLYTSLFSMLISLTALLGSNEMFEAVAFLRAHPRAVTYITAVSSVAAVIQYFVAYTIKNYGALNFATLMTARQFLSVIASCIVFKHSFTLGQWCAPTPQWATPCIAFLLGHCTCGLQARQSVMGSHVFVAASALALGLMLQNQSSVCNVHVTVHVLPWNADLVREHYILSETCAQYNLPERSA